MQVVQQRRRPGEAVLAHQLLSQAPRLGRRTRCGASVEGRLPVGTAASPAPRPRRVLPIPTLARQAPHTVAETSPTTARRTSRGSTPLSPSSSQVLSLPSSRRSGCSPPQAISIRLPQPSRSGPDTVPVARRSPVRSAAPFDVRCATSCDSRPVDVARLGRLTTVSFRDELQVHVVCPRLGAPQLRRNLLPLLGTVDPERARARHIGTTQAEIEVANDLPRNGPRGWYSNAWTSLADQSLTSTTCRKCVRGVLDTHRAPALLPRPTTKPSSTSTSSRCSAGRAVRPPCDHPGGAPNRRAAHDDRPGPPVVAEGYAAPSGRVADRSRDAGSCPCWTRGVPMRRSRSSRRFEWEHQRGPATGRAPTVSGCRDLLQAVDTARHISGPSDMNRLSDRKRKCRPGSR